MQIFNEETVNKNYEEYMGLIKGIKRDGVERFVKWAEKSDLKTAPASTQYNLSCYGGLVKHCLNVYNEMNRLNEVYKFDIEQESIIIVALLYELSKVNYYDLTYRNLKDDNGRWVQEPYYKVKKADERKLFYGTAGETSVYMAREFFKLTYDEEIAILYATAGASGSEVPAKYLDTFTAYKKSELAFLLRMAVASAVIIDEND